MENYLLCFLISRNFSSLWSYSGGEGKEALSTCHQSRGSVNISRLLDTEAFVHMGTVFLMCPITQGWSKLDVCC